MAEDRLELAKTFDEPGHKIRVKEDSGRQELPSSSLASLRFATAPTGFRLASARICKCAYLAPCQNNNNDQRSRKKRLIEALKNIDVDFRRELTARDFHSKGSPA